MTMLMDRPDVADPDDMTDPELFAVYGTLRTDCGNDRLWRGRADSLGLDTVDGMVLAVRHEHAGFPYALRADEGNRIVVELLRPHPDRRASLMADLDGLEGHPSHYTRTVVETVGGVFAWCYLASPRTHAGLAATAGAFVIDSGDWCNR